MYRLDLVGECLINEQTNKPIKPGVKGFEKAFVEYLIRGISNGSELNTLLPVEAGFLPAYADVVDLMADDRYKDAFAKAEAVRSRRSIEDSREVAQRAKHKPTKENIDLAKVFENMAAREEKKQKHDPITLSVPRFVFDGFWGEDAEFKAVAEPEYKDNKRIK